MSQVSTAQFVAPSDSKPYWVYQSSIFGRSLVIVLAVILADLLLRKVRVFTILPFRTSGIAPNGLRVMNVLVPYSSHHSIQRICSSYCWVVRTAVVMVVCIGFDLLVVNNSRFDMRRSGDWNDIIFQCLTGWDCYAWQPPNSDHVVVAEPVKSLPSFLPLWFVWDLTHICSMMTSGNVEYDDSITSRSQRRGAAVCYRVSTFQFSDAVTGLGLMAVAGILVFACFECIVIVMLKYRRGVWNVRLLVDIIIAISLIGWLAMLTAESYSAISAWVSRLTFLAIPIILYCGRVVGTLLRQELEKKQEARGRELLHSKFGEELDKLANTNEDDILIGETPQESGGVGSSLRRRLGRPRLPRRLGLWSKLKGVEEKDENATSEKSTDT
eukprot:Blabericola_migrator_1__2575@NODE_1729_length_3908_cov_210_810726_g1116_i0_p2_GENE_NODE_1729_length_3908_cov_210_810726_g1116_i0NODE_1729_length_3908_cov_210_810726_g1116_i0_p2_ORF_typecomplete_len383_score21_72DUF1440/PF07274_12/0_2DRMBL/PF07522_14/17DRMBL/PF07522_14/74Fig1/PF12351_8/3_6e03Fig1/PF12351_8/0_17_NODE_1729_length_3908_cov_210_810726_g1116_i015882736